ncbi:hypothetical protein JT358_00275 [Micrococcales bacterium 31B]|nr:hypothetical protein [Micrococcales bacterium 31B]
MIAGQRSIAWSALLAVFLVLVTWWGLPLAFGWLDPTIYVNVMAVVPLLVMAAMVTLEFRRRSLLRAHSLDAVPPARRVVARSMQWLALVTLALAVGLVLASIAVFFSGAPLVSGGIVDAGFTFAFPLVFLSGLANAVLWVSLRPQARRAHA